MHNVVFVPESFFSWHTLNDAIADLPPEPHVLMLNRTSWVQLILTEVLEQGILLFGFGIITDIFQAIYEGDIQHQPYYFLFLLAIWVNLICQNYEWHEFIDHSRQWFIMMSCMLLLNETSNCIPLLIIVGVYNFINDLQMFLYALPPETEIKMPFKIFNKNTSGLDIEILFDDLMLCIVKKIKPQDQKILLDARAQWSLGLHKNITRILTTAETLPQGFVLDVRSNHLFDDLNDEDYFNRLVQFQNGHRHLNYEKNGQSDSRDAYLIILSFIKQSRLPASLCLEIYAFLFNAEEQHCLLKFPNNKQFSTTHVYQWMKKKKDELGMNSKAISAISLG